MTAHDTGIRREYLRQRLAQQGYTVVTFAKVVGLSKSKLYNVLRGHADLRLTQLAWLARVLHCCPWQLIQLPGDPPACPCGRTEEAPDA